LLALHATLLLWCIEPTELDQPELLDCVGKQQVFKTQAQVHARERTALAQSMVTELEMEAAFQ